MADLPDLTHQWLRPKSGGWWECACGDLTASPRTAQSSFTLCPARVRAWGAQQRAAGAATERARIVAWLRAKAEAAFAVRERQTVADYGHYGAAYTWAADAIERGEDCT